MAHALFQFLISAGIIIAAGTALTKYADAIADLTGIGRLLVGSILLAGATSLPELTVDLSAVFLGSPNMAVGDLMGSSLFNLLILALLDMLHYGRGKMFSRASAAHALSGMSSMLIAAVAGVVILVAQHPESARFMEFGAGSGAILVAYLFAARLVYFDQRVASQVAEHQPQKVLVPAGRLSLKHAITGFVVAAIIILVAGPFLAEAAGDIAEQSKLGGTFMGTTFVALCTSLPELVASLAAVRLGAYDLALGNIFGSNTFNMLLLIPLDMAYPGSLFPVISVNHVLTALATILITALAVMGQLYQVESRNRFIEPDALLVILLVLGALGLLYWLR